ncbi:MAG TPA: serine/threonine-protein kinase, partial [Vulgatibacter sp.]
MEPHSSAGPLGPALPASFGRYTLLERVGGGGMAPVYRASLVGDGGFEKDVAVKVIRQELSEDSQFTDMFLDEARLSARLTHANIVQTFDFGRHEGVHFLAMELVRGRTLAAILRICKAKGVRLGLAPSLHVAAEIARGLGYAHRLAGPGGEALGIVHRDVSPQNVLLSREGEVKLADFGIAKAVNRSHVTQPGRVRGKCAYMAPEQIRGQELDGRADVFALGVVLWECLTCRPLFDGDSDAAVLMQVLEKELERPSVYAPEVPPAVDELALRLLSRDRRDRPDATQAARELADLTLKLIRSQADIDLAELQRRLGS